MSGRLRSRLIWNSTKPNVLESAPSGFQMLARIPEVDSEAEEADLKLPMAPRERAIAFLHIGSEIEHALMVQYLYAAYSLNESQSSEPKRALVNKWKSVILEIAREEMGHLATVQNMLTLIGGPLCFERDDYPIADSDLWPFPFELERLTRTSLGKYVLAEMPSEEALKKLGLTDEINAIKARLKMTDDLIVHRVGRIYEKIIRLFTLGPMIQGPIVPQIKLHPFVATVDIQADSLKYQVNPSAWGLGYSQVLIEVASDRDSALKALKKISVQGEGPLGENDEDLKDEYQKSHFRRFLDIYREFPEEDDWQPSRLVASNPTTNPGSADPARKIDGPAACWAGLANLRYHMLLLYLKHSFYIEAASSAPLNSPRGALVSWAFGEMYNLRSLSEILMNLPLNSQINLRAGPPFEMPFTLGMAARSANRWRSHRDLLTASVTLIDEMLTASPGHEKYLRALRASDETALEQVTVLIGV